MNKIYEYLGNTLCLVCFCAGCPGCVDGAGEHTEGG